MITVVYFAWVRERIGLPKENIETDAGTVQELVEELKAREPRYQAAFAEVSALRVALEVLTPAGPVHVHLLHDRYADRTAPVGRQRANGRWCRASGQRSSARRPDTMRRSADRARNGSVATSVARASTASPWERQAT